MRAENNFNNQYKFNWPMNDDDPGLINLLYFILSVMCVIAILYMVHK